MFRTYNATGYDEEKVRKLDEAAEEIAQLDF